MSASAATPVMFSSVSALRAAHRDLQREFRVKGEQDTELLDRIEAFLHQAQATGAILDSDENQATVQSIIDLWVTTLYRVGRHTGDFTLAEFDKSRAPELDESQAPYVGLASFSELEHDRFFGRQKMIEHLLERLATENFLVIIGPSGSGKSSLVLAGLLPAIRRGCLPGSEQWTVLRRIVPGADPLASLARCVRPASAMPGWSEAQAALMRSDPNHLRKLADAFGEGQPCVFVVDQLEELATLCEDETVRLAVQESVVNLVRATSPRHIVIVTMRSDFVSLVAGQPQMQALIEQAIEPVTPLSAPELREAIVKPAERAGLKFEPGVVESLVHDILGEPAALPLLQFTLQKLWETRERNLVTAAAYKKLGGGRLALTRSADKFYDALIPEDKTMVDRILLRIVRPGQGMDVVSSRVLRKSLYSIGDPGQVDRVLGKLVDERLIRLTEGDSPDTAEVEVAHEALVRNWAHLVQLLDGERERMTRYRRLELKASEWQRLGRGKAGLLAGGALLEAQEWIQGEDARILGASPNLLALVAESEEAERAIARRDFWFKVVLIVLTMAALFFAVLGRIQRNRAVASEKDAIDSEREATKQTKEARGNLQKAREASEQWIRTNLDLQAKDAELQQVTRQLDEKAHMYDSDHLADASTKALASDPDVSTLRAVESAVVLGEVGQRGSSETQEALRQAVLANRARLSIGAPGKLRDATFTPDGKHVAIVNAGKPVQLWSTIDGRAEPAGGIAPAHAGLIASSLLGTWAAADGSGIRIYSADGRPGNLLDAGDTVTRLAFSPDGKRLAAAAGAQAYVWDLSGSPQRIKLAGLPGAARVNAVALSFDGAFVAIAGDADVIRVFDASKGTLLREWKGHAGPVRDLAFSPDGAIVASAGQDHTAKLSWWLDAARPDVLPRNLIGHLDAVTSVAFSPDGSKIATGSRDQTAKVWSAATAIEQFSLPRQPSAVAKVQFNLDGTRLLSAGEDGAVRLWNAGAEEDAQTVRLEPSPAAPLRNPMLPPLTAWPSLVVAGTSGKTIVTSTSDGAFRVWGVTDSGVRLARVIRRKGSSAAVAVNGKATMAASVDSAGREIELYDLQKGTATAIPGPNLPAHALALSTDGKRLAFGSDQKVVILDAANGAVVRSADVDSTVEAVTFSAGGSLVGAALDSGTAVVFDASLKVVAQFPKHAGALRSIAFSPDGRRIVTGGFEKVAKVWSVEKPSLPPLELADHSRWITGVAFSPDGRSVATTSADGTAKLWPLPQRGSEVEPQTFGTHGGTLCCVAFTADGKRIVTAGYDATLRLYELQPGDLLALALSRLSRPFTPADCLGQDQPQRCRALLPALNAVVEGNRLARTGRIDEARARYAAARGPELKPNPDALARTIRDQTQNSQWESDVDGRLALAEALAVVGQREPSGRLLAEAVQRRGVAGSAPDFSPDALDHSPSRSLYQNLATMLVRTRDNDELARDYYERSWQWGSPAISDAPLRAKRFMSSNLLFEARTMVNRKQFDRALQYYVRARVYTDGAGTLPETEPLWLNELCWGGSLRGLFANPDIREACDSAVRISNGQDTSIIDSRGLNRALNQHFDEAAADFQKYADDSRKPPASILQRIQWVLTLMSGHSPFDAATIKALAAQDELVQLPISAPVY